MEGIRSIGGIGILNTLNESGTEGIVRVMYALEGHMNIISIPVGL
jgi:hypothetical protein